MAVLPSSPVSPLPPCSRMLFRLTCKQPTLNDPEFVSQFRDRDLLACGELQAARHRNVALSLCSHKLVLHIHDLALQRLNRQTKQMNARVRRRVVAGRDGLFRD